MAYQDTDANGRIWNTKLTANDSTPKEAPGATRELSDGRKFRYIKMTGSALSLGLLVMPATKVAVTNATSVNGPGPDGATTTIITDSDATWTPDAYIGWYFQVATSMTGSTEPIKIVGNSATTLTLEKSIGTALAVGGTDDGEIIAGTAAGILTAVTDEGQPVIGVGIGTITQNYYGWVQTEGIGAVVGDTLTENESISPGGNAVGQAIVSTNDSDNVIIGNVISTSGDNEFALCQLHIS